MIPCAQYEEWLSAHLDGELERETALAALAHALECSSCGDFYRACKKLSVAVAAAGEPVGAPPEAVWDGVRRVVGWRRSSELRAAWMWRAAAVLAVALGAWWLSVGGPAGQGGGAAPRAGTAAVATTTAGRMTDQRFAQLAGEVLAAEPRYRRALLGALESVGRHSDEGAGDEYSVRSESFQPLLVTPGRL